MPDRDIVAHATPKNRKKTKPIYAQLTPADRCKSPELLYQQALDRNLKNGEEYICKCRRASCSVQCSRDFSEKVFHSVGLRIEEIPDDYLLFRGCLQLAKGSTVEQHVQAKKLFQQNLRRSKVKHGYVLEIFAQRHATDIYNCHWDYTVFTNAPKTIAKSIIADAWKRAGGKHQSVMPLDRQASLGWIQYQAKDPFSVEHESDDDPDPESDSRLIPAPRSVCGLQTYWSTSGFFGDGNLEDYWQKQIDIWFPERVAKREEKQSGLQLVNITDIASTFDPANPETYCEISEKLTLDDLLEMSDLTPFQTKLSNLYLATKREPKRDLNILGQVLKDTIYQSMGADRIAEKLNWDVDYTFGLLNDLKSQGRAAVTNGELVNGKLRYNGWWRGS